MKKRAFVKHNKNNGEIIPGSLIITTSGGYPKDYLYQEVPICICVPNTGIVPPPLPPLPDGLRLGFFDISFAYSLVGGDILDVNLWNTFFGLPGNGNPFTGVTAIGNDVCLEGGSNINIPNFKFQGVYFKSIQDTTNCVITLGNNCFETSVINTVDLPAVTSIGNSCFAACQYITTFNLPSLVTAGDNAFTNCQANTIFNFPNLVTVGIQCFTNCSQAITFNLPSLVSIPNNCFENCGSATQFNLPSAVTAGDNAFYNCSSVTDMLYGFILPSLTTAGIQCFANCDSVVIWDGLPNLTTAGAYCFYQCDQAVTFVLPSLVTAGYGCFVQCSNVKNFNLPLVTSVGGTAFAQCPALSTAPSQIFLPSCTNLGGNPGNDSVFFGTSNAVGMVLTVKASLATINGGNPDGDIQFLTDPLNGNNISVVYVP